MPLRTPFGRATWGLDAVVIWSGGLSGIAWFLGWLQGLGVGIAFLLALAAFPLAFLSCVLARHRPEIARAIAAFFGSDREAGRVVNHRQIPAHIPTVTEGDEADKLSQAIARYKDDVDVLADKLERTRLDGSDTQKHLNDISMKLDHVNRVLGSATNDVRTLIEHCVFTTELQMFQTARWNTPSGIEEYVDQEEITEEWLDEQYRLAEEYISYVSSSLSGTQWFAEVLETQAEAEAERCSISLDAGRCSQHINPEKFKRYVVAKIRYDLITALLLRKSENAEARLGQQLATLEESLHHKVL